MEFDGIPSRRFCSASCSASYNNKRRNTKTCRVCSVPVVGRIFCGSVCYAAYRRSTATGHRTVRARLLRKFGEKCWKCGWNKVNPSTGRSPLVMNHVDGDSTNMVDSNLELLCPNCDSLTPTYKALNRGRGRHWRAQRFREGKSY